MSLRPRLEAIPAWAWLVAIFVVSVAIRFVIARRHPAPWIYSDELIYSALAKNLAATGHFAVRDVHGLLGYGPLYPLLISPAYRAFDDLAHAYTAAKGINAVVMSAALLPAYLIARRFVGRWLALVAGVLAIAVPSMEYTSTIMTENLFYPLFLLCAWAMIRALERPALGSQLLAAGLIVPAFFTRAQAVALVPALVTAVLLYVLAEAWAARELGDARAVGRRLRVFAPTFLAVAAGGVLVLAYELARGHSLSNLLGTYQGLTGTSYSVATVARWFAYHLAELDLYVGILPFAAFLVLTVELFRRRGSARPLRAFTAVALSLVLWLTLVVAAFSAYLEQLDHIGRIEERNLFHVAPLLLIALLIWVDGRVPRTWLVTGAAAVVAGLLPAVIPYTRFVNLSALSDTFIFIPLWRLAFFGVIGFGTIKLIVVLCALGGAALFVLLPRRYALLAPLAVLVYFFAVERSLEHQVAATSQGVLASAITVRREWIDDHVGRGAQVAAVETAASNPRVVPEDEFFNRSVRAVYDVGAPPGGAGLPARPASVDPRTGALRDASGAPIHTPYALGDVSLSLRGTPVATDPGVGAIVYRIRGPLALVDEYDGVFPDGWTGSTVTYTRFRCRGGKLVLGFAGQPGLVKTRRSVVAETAGRVVARTAVLPSGQPKLLRVPLRRRGDLCAVTLTISPTVVPAEVLGTPDTRTLGLRLTSRAFEPPGT